MAITPSNLPTIQRLKYEDIARAKDWQEGMGLLINNLNLFITPTYNILNGGVTYQNLQAPQLYSKVITASATTTFSFTNPLIIAPSAVLIGNCWTGIPSTHPAVALQIYWHYSNNQIVVDNVVGLTVATTYQLTLVIL